MEALLTIFHGYRIIGWELKKRGSESIPPELKMMRMCIGLNLSLMKKLLPL